MQEAGALADAMQAAPRFLTDTINQLVYTGDERDGRAGIFAATNAGLFRSYDLTKGWERLSYGGGFDTRTLCVSTSEQDSSNIDRKSTRLNSSHANISYAGFCLKKKKIW